MEVRNSAAETQTSDQTQPIQEIDADGVSKVVGGPVDVVVADGGGGGVEVELGSGGGGVEMVKKKRGRPPRVQVKLPPAKMNKEEDEDVCFICFDGGSLVLCDRRGCPKAYHPACVKRDEAFFQSKAKWTCGWHICSICQKAAQHMCYTCTYSLCKGCIKKADYVCVRGDKGFCTVCMKTIMLIENNGQGKDEKAQVDFDDKTSWEYLFKVYWVYLKGKLSLTLDELTQAKNPWKGAGTATSVSPSTCVDNGGNDLKSVMSDMPLRNLEASDTKRRKTDEQITIPHKETVSTKDDESSSVVACKDWATKELLDFVAHMKNGDASVLSQFDVQELMLEYIKRNNLRDPRKKSQIICDLRLKSLFGKPRVGHFEMLKLLEFHFFIKEDLPKNTINSIARQVDPDWNGDSMQMVGKDKKRKNHRKGEERAPQNKLDEYAAIDVHNMNLVYLRRKLMENLIEDGEMFHGKVVGSIVRIRISGSDQKHDMYRLVQVVGTSKADAPYKIGDKSADVVLEVLNLDKKETISIDTISNHDLSEDECRRLRQSIKCGLVKRFTVGEIQDKAVSLQSVRLNDWMEAEILRLNNLRDRASEKGHKKGLRECVEKLQLLKTPEERERRLREIPEVHSDPKMNPDYETDDTEEYFNKEHVEHTKLKYVGVSRKNTIPPKKRADFSSNVGGRSWKNEQSRHVSLTTEEGSTKAMGRINMAKDAHGSSRPQNQVESNGSPNTNWNHHINGTASETATTSYSIRCSNDSEMDKVWHYRDPSGKVQGPFCMLQLQKWSTTGYFPADMRIWTNREDGSLLLNDVLKEQLHNARLSENKTATDKVGMRIEGLTVRTANPLPTVHVNLQTCGSDHEKLSDGLGSSGQSSFAKSNGQSDTHNLASPTPVVNNANIKHVSSVFDIADAALVELPSPTPKEMSSHEDEKVQNAGDKEQHMPSSEILVQDVRNQDVGRAQLPKAGDEWNGYSPTQVKREDWNSVPKAEGDHVRVATTTSNIQQIIHSPPPPPPPAAAAATTQVKHEEWNSVSKAEGDHVHAATTTSNIQHIIHSSSPPAAAAALPPTYSYLPPWNGVGETIEFNTLAEESVSDLLAEVDAMESQNGFPSPTSRRNSFVEDLFNGSFEEFSPTPDQGVRSNGFSSTGADIQLGCQIATTTTMTTAATYEHAVGTNNGTVFDFICPERKSENMPFKWPEDTISNDISHSSELKTVNKSTKAEADEEERDAKTSYVEVDEEKGIQMRTSTKPKDESPELALGVSQTTDRAAGDDGKEEDGVFTHIGLEAAGAPPPSRRVGSEAHIGRPSVNTHLSTSRGGWDPHQRMYGGVERYNNNSPRERIYKVEDSGYNNNNNNNIIINNKSSKSSWGRQSSFGNGGGSGGGGGYSRPLPPKGQRVCKFYESGRCKKGASCNYWHP